MSLPSQATFNTVDGAIIDTQFINVGWYLTPETLARAVLFDLTDHQYDPTDTVTVYGLTIPISIIRTVQNQTELAERIEPFLAQLSHQQGDHDVIVS